MQKVVITEFMDEDAIREHLIGFDVTYDARLVDRPDALKALLGTVDALVVRNRTQVRAELLAAAPRLTFVGRLGVGLDNIDVEACEQRGIKVCPATGANDDAVAEYVVGAALLLLRGAFWASAAVAAGEWPRTSLMGREIGGKLLGLIGFGAIARETARRAAALGMTVAAFDPHLPVDHPAWRPPFGPVERLTREELLARSDVVSCHVPLTPQTRDMVDAAAIALMPRGAILINAARGGIVDEAAVVDALREGRLGGAALDVFAFEPLNTTSGAAFLNVPNLILTPHIAGVTQEANVRVSSLVARAVRRHLMEA